MSASIHESPQYSERSVRRYERIFGEDFLSTGGPETTHDICAGLNLQPGTRVLDVGSGIGGSAFYMSREFGCVVTGVDVLAPLVEIANNRAASKGIAGVRFLQGDILETDMPECGFDLVYSRDAMLHIEDKERLFNRLFSLLAPGGRIFISDYATGTGLLSTEFTDYIRDTGYFLRPIETYVSEIAAAGFVDVKGEDKTNLFVDILKREIERAESLPPNAEEGLSPEDCDYLVSRWTKKIGWCNSEQMKWGYFQARKPA
ncbi:MAG: methyltransferase domain-containing protein [Candidatus Hydrogenedens sp.]|nr:methyltransferase domain-containing protein [Candidatus Hydrogenedens sp.]